PQCLAADEIALVHGQREVQARFERVELGVDVLAPEAVALLQPERVLGGETGRRDPVRPPGLPEDVPEPKAVFSWSVDLPAVFADIRDPKGDGGHTADRHFGRIEAAERERLLCDRIEDGLRPRTPDADAAPGRGFVGHAHRTVRWRKVPDAGD